MRALGAFLAFALFGAAPVRGQVEGHRILFPDSTALAVQDRQSIFEQLGYSVSADGAALAAPDCGPITSRTEEVDLNGDGALEVFVIGGNACTSGMDGSSLTLFIRNAEGRYAPHLGFPGGGWTRLETASGGFPDLAIGGAGFCEAVYRWDGSTYQHAGNRETAAGGCDGIG